MADNLTLNVGADGKDLATAEVTFSGDTADVQICGGGIVTGSAESYSVTLIVGGAGAVAGGVQRVTLASDDPAVVDLAAMEVLLGTIDTDTGNIATSVASIDGNITACNTGAVVISSGTITTVSSVTAIANALPAGDNNIGNVDIITLPSGNLGARAMTASLSTTIATDDTHYGAVGAAADVDGVIHGQLRYMGEYIATIDADTGAIKTAVELIDNTVAVLGTATYSETTTSGNVVGVVRNDDLATLANTDNEIAPLQVNSAGALFTEPSQQVDYVFDGSTKCTIERNAVIAATGTVEIAAAPSGTQFVRVLALAIVATSATVTNVYLKTATNDILGDAANPIKLSTDADGDNMPGLVLPWNPGGWFQTATADEALSIVLSAAQDVIVTLTWIDVD